jgi:hypothetical protein
VEEVVVNLLLHRIYADEFFTLFAVNLRALLCCWLDADVAVTR